MPLPLFPYQEAGAQWLAVRDRAGLFDEMGIGKTATAIRALDMIRARRILIVAPAMVRENWRGEFRKFSTIERRILKGQNIHDYVAWSRGRFDVLITSYELATKWTSKIDKAAGLMDVLIFDESHYLKTPDALRTKTLFGTDRSEGLCRWAAKTWCLTGTPMPNDPVDIYTWLRFVRALGLTHNQFINRFFTSHLSSYSNRNEVIREEIPTLRTLIWNNAIRRTKQEVGIQLPPIFLTSVLVDGDTREVANLLAQHPTLAEQIVAAIEEGGLTKLDRFADHLMTLRRLLGEAKAIPYAEMLLYELRTGLDKMVVFGIHRKALIDTRNYLVAHGINAVLVNGDTPEKERIQHVQTFQCEPSCRVFIGNIRTAGTGLTLTASANIDMLESDWSPAGNAQAIMRTHRLGQTRTVRARFIQLAGTFDETVTRIVVGKTTAIADVEGSRMHAAPMDAAG